MRCLECGSNRVEELMLYRCPDCGAEVVSRPPRKLHPAVLPSDYQQTIDALKADLARVTAERDRLRDTLSEIYISADDRQRIFDLIDKALESEE